MTPNRGIAVIDKGWVIVGEYTATPECAVGKHTFTDAAVIRNWGTTRGVGQLALEGPQKTTVFDPIGTVILDGIVLFIPWVSASWWR